MKTMRTFTALLFATALFAGSSAHAFGRKETPPPPYPPMGATEPAYCDPATFSQKFEIKVQTPSTKRAHAYRLGSVTVAGMAVGGQDVGTTEALAHELGTAGSSRKYCTFYFNDGNSSARKTFVWSNLDNPNSISTEEAVKQFNERVAPLLGSASINMTDCLEETGYAGMGCDGQKHRGPGVFAALLAYSGCMPDHAAAIAYQVWGLNGVPWQTRQAIAEAAAARAQAEPAQSARLRELFSR